MNANIAISQEFYFEAAHSLPSYGDVHPNARVHGHSFRARVSLDGPLDAHGQVIDLKLIDQALQKLRVQLDHQMLNDIIDTPTLENIAIWIWNSLINQFSKLALVEVFRDSLGQSCRYAGEHA